MITAASAGLSNRMSTFTHGVCIHAFTQGFPNMAGCYWTGIRRSKGSFTLDSSRTTWYM
jgi:hypothetical protein